MLYFSASLFFQLLKRKFAIFFCFVSLNNKQLNVFFPHLLFELVFVQSVSFVLIFHNCFFNSLVQPIVFHIVQLHSFVGLI